MKPLLEPLSAHLRNVLVGNATIETISSACSDSDSVISESLARFVADDTPPRPVATLSMDGFYNLLRNGGCNMTSLSIAKHGALPFTIAADAIFIVESSPDEIIFEMLDADAELVRTFLDVPSLYTIESQSFLGTLTSLELAKALIQTWNCSDRSRCYEAYWR